MPLTLDAFKAHLDAAQLWPDGSTVLVGYSGGADSTALLHLLKRAGVDVIGAHLHHGMREEADDELKACERFCDTIEAPFVSGRADVPLMSREMKIGLEEAGRRARYRFFDQAKYATQATVVATAHTRTDSAETVLLNLTRGSGLSGLAGIPERRDHFVRPLLPFTRHETRSYCREHGLSFHDDPANADTAFSRTRVRLNVFPELREINPGVEEAIARLSELVKAEDEFLDGAAAAALERSELALNGPLEFLTRNVEVALDAEMLRHLPAVLLNRAVRLVVKALGAGLEYGQVETVRSGLIEGNSGSITAEGGLVDVRWTADELLCTRADEPAPFRQAVTLPGETIADEFGWSLIAFTKSFEGERSERRGLEVYADAEVLKAPLTLRTWERGDVIRPLGFDGTRKISDLMAEFGLSRQARARIPVICDLMGPIWIPGICLDGRASVVNSTKKVLVLRFGPAQEEA